MIINITRENDKKMENELFDYIEILKQLGVVIESKTFGIGNGYSKELPTLLNFEVEIPIIEILFEFIKEIDKPVILEYDKENNKMKLIVKN